MKIKVFFFINDITDHLPISTLCLYEVKRNPRKYLYIREKIKKNYLKKLNSKLRKENYMSVINVDINIAYDNFLRLYSQVYSQVLY